MNNWQLECPSASHDKLLQFVLHDALQVAGNFFVNLIFFKHLGDSFFSPFTTHQYTSLVQKHPILLKFGAFLW